LQFFSWLQLELLLRLDVVCFLSLNRLSLHGGVVLLLESLNQIADGLLDPVCKLILHRNSDIVAELLGEVFRLVQGSQITLELEVLQVVGLLEYLL
jgi:hypothetical protein